MDSIFGIFAGLGVCALALFLGISAMIWVDKLPDPQPVNYTTVEKSDRMSLPCPEVK